MKDISLADLRARARLTQADLANQVNVCSMTISRLERGLITPDWNAACALADVLGVSLDVLRVAVEKSRDSRNP